ncbi:MAG TPA: heme lyase CcmF/NrfE family subunit, partial [Thermomonas sp.]|nr:heme lyase CcmF/NrfE family subunit [Thermomonas sp.]
AWGNHEGSMLMWCLVACIYGFAAASRAPKDGRDESWLDARAAAVQGVIATLSFAYLIFASNPFARLDPAPLRGGDLNPLLQDPALAIHPPLLYMGYVGMSVVYSYAIAGLWSRAEPKAWAKAARPWALAAWSFLTIGITLGAYWAYYELGWGGWWFWDPVENASFMPWLAGTALLHSQAVTEKRGSFAGWTLLLAISAFSLSLLGTFLVRSGVLTSVHAFAADPSRGLFVLVFLGIVIGGSLVLYALRAPDNDANAKPFAAGSRETLLLLNNLLLTTACAMVLLGTLYPLLADALELGKISVGPPYFAMMFLLLMAPLVLLLPFGPLTRWQREDMAMPLRMLLPWAALALVLGVATFFLAPQGGWKTAAGIVGATWVAAGTLRFLWSRWTMPGARLTREMWGMTLAHLGIAVFLIGALLDDGLAQQREVAVKPGGSVTLGQHCFVLKGVQHLDGPNYSAERGTVEVLRHCSDPVATLHPEKRSYRGGQVMSEVALDRGFTRDLYVALGEPLGEGAWALRVHVKPFVRWIWAGALLMALGGLVTATDKRFRARWDDGKPQGVRA